VGEKEEEDADHNEIEDKDTGERSVRVIMVDANDENELTKLNALDLGEETVLLKMAHNLDDKTKEVRYQKPGRELGKLFETPPRRPF
jgi:hypothetical protein